MTSVPSTSLSRIWYLLAAAFPFAVLLIRSDSQIFDTNFYSLWQATALLAGEHPYRDFFEWGIPLATVTSAFMQWLVGNRLIGEFLIHWAFIVAGAVVSFDVGLRLSRSITGGLIAAFATALLLSETPSFLYPKLFFYPAGIWLAWKYLDAPTVRWSLALGLLSATGFLFRHDHGVYLGVLCVLTFIVTRIATPASRHVGTSLRHAAAYATVVLLIIGPWALVVHTSEGLPQYVHARSELFRKWSAGSKTPFRALRQMSVVPVFRPDPPPSRSGEIAFRWNDAGAQSRGEALMRDLGARTIQAQGPEAPARYAVDNVVDLRVLELAPLVHDVEGIDWSALELAASWLPKPNDAVVWLMQVGMLATVLLLVAGIGTGVRSWRRGSSVSRDACRMVVAAAFLLLVERAILREPSYIEGVAPVVAALSVRLVVGDRRQRDAAQPARRSIPPRQLLRWAVTFPLIILTGINLVAFTRRTEIYAPAVWPERVRVGFDRLTVSPAIEAEMPGDDVRRYTRARWDAGQLDVGRVLLRYMHDCTADGDRIGVTGSTPYQVGYLVNRPVVGHVFWHFEWRADPVREQELLALFRQQPVPFFFSTHDPVMDDLGRYPAIHAYFKEYYVPLEGSRGLLLIDRRRQPTGTYEPLGFPCFQRDQATRTSTAGT